MFKSNHVGRPSNQELKTRKIKKAIVILLPVIIIFIGIIVISKGNLKSLMGNSVTTEYYCEDESYNLDGKECVKTITVEPNLLGDANKDGKININDVTAIQKAISSNNTSDIIYVADVNGDKLVNETDLKMIQSFLSGESDQSTVGHTENIGVSLVCPSDFTIDNKVCKKQDKVQAIAVERLQDDDKQASDSSNNSSVNSQDDTKKEENSNSKIEANNNTYTITFDANGGTGTMSDQTVQVGQDVNLAKNQFVNKGYQFLGWEVYNQNKKQYLCYRGSGQKSYEYQNESLCVYGKKIFKDQSIIKNLQTEANNKIVLIAQWSNQFTVKFNANGGTGSMSDLVVTIGNDTKLSENKFTKADYYFKGWNVYNQSRKKWMCYKDSEKRTQGYMDEKDCKYGKSLYKNGQTVSKTTTIGGEVLVFYAQWDKINNAIGISIKPQDSKTSIAKNVKYRVNVEFNIKDTSRQYYYNWVTYKYGNKVYTSNCQKVNGGVKPKDLTINGTRKGTITVYSDASCKNRLVSKDTKTYTCSNCAPLTISIGKLNVTNMSKGTVVHNGIVFNVLDSSKSYYHQWRTYTNGKLTFTGSCIKITGGKQYVKDLTINGTRKGTITVYSDNKCSKRITTVPMAETQTFTCKDCNVSNNSNSNYQPSYNNSSSGNKSNKSNKSECKLYNYSYTCPSGWTKVGDGPTAYCQQQTGYYYTCPSGYTKVGDGPTAYCQSKTKTAGKCKYNRNILKNGGFSCSVNSGKFRDLPSCQKKCYVRNTQSIKKKKNYATKKITATKNCIG